MQHFHCMALVGKDFTAAQNLFADLCRRAEGQRLLRIHAPAPEHDPVAVLGLDC
jgi:hypothetical protein